MSWVPLQHGGRVGRSSPWQRLSRLKKGNGGQKTGGSLRLFESLLSRTGAVVRLRFAGTGPLPEKPDPPTPPSTDIVPEPPHVAPSVYGPLPQVRGIRWSRTGERIRAVLDLTAAVEPDVRTFPGSVELTLRAASNSSLGGVPSPYPGDVSVGITQFGEKIVVRFQHSAGSVKTFPLHKPERLVVDFLAQGAKEEPVLPLPVSVEPESRAIPVEPPPVSLPPSVFPGKKPDGKPFLIAVDAGHGGHDPGAVAGGFREKDLNLKAAKRLVELLKEAGLEGRLTRRDDTYLRLNERTELANRWNADLFVSLHCNALPRGRHARGLKST